jgi:argininosuccinate lyase
MGQMAHSLTQNPKHKTHYLNMQLWNKHTNDNINRDWFFDFTTAEDRACDEHLISYDIRCNLAQAEMLEKIGVYSSDELNQVRGALNELHQEWVKGEFTLQQDDEDVHSAIEKALIKRCGDPGMKIHTGRSRNDQVLTDIRMFAKDQLLGAMELVNGIIGQLERLAGKYNGVMFAGYTHTQPAMPTSVDAWAYGYMDSLLQNQQALKQAFNLVDQSPLGAAAGYGVPFLSIDRELTAKLLGFSRVQWAVTAVQLQRGAHEKQVVGALSAVAYTLNRLASDVVFLSSNDRGIITLSEDQTSGSSIMPQKRNPDAWELIRAEYSWFVGVEAQLGATGVNLISGYHRDFQITKKALMDAFARAERLFRVAEKCLSGTEFNAEKCKSSLTAELFATHRALEAVVQGVPFREAYRAVGTSLENHASLEKYLEMGASAYKVAGFPGHPAAEYYQKERQAHAQWVQAELQKTNKVIEHALRPLA